MKIQFTDSPLRENLLARVRSRMITDPETGCWLWTGATNYAGYGVFSVWLERGRRPQFRVHRLVYELMVAPIPDGLTLDHLCRQRACANPDHLEAVTAEENIRRAAATRATCKWGHVFDRENTAWRVLVSGGRRRACKQCAREKALRRYHATKELHPKVLATHCGRGHEFDEANTYVVRGKRHCRVCARERYHARKAG